MNIRTALIRLARATATTAALTLLTAATTTATHAGSTPNDPVPEGTAFVDAASLPANELRGLDQPIPYARYARSHGVKSVTRQAAADPAPGDQQDLRQQCANHAAQAKAATGWIKSRFESCQKRPFDLVLRDVRGTTSIGRLWFGQWVLGFAYDGSRRVDYVASIENIKVQPLPTEDATQWRVGQHFHHNINAAEPRPGAR